MKRDSQFRENKQGLLAFFWPKKTLCFKQKLKLWKMDIPMSFQCFQGVFNELVVILMKMNFDRVNTWKNLYFPCDKKIHYKNIPGYKIH